METDNINNDSELTSTMGNLMSLNKDDKNEANDSTPTSSTDAFTATSSTQIVPDDPISSTSSDTQDVKKSEEQSTEATTNVIVMEEKTATETLIASEKDWLTMSITDTGTEKITEDVEDIVQDLENLLGEPTTSFDFTIKSKDNRRSANKSGAQTKNVSGDNTETLEDLLVEKPTPATEEPNTVFDNLEVTTVPNSVESKPDTDATISNETKESQVKSEENRNFELSTVEPSKEVAQEIDQTVLCNTDAIIEKSQTKDVTESLKLIENVEIIAAASLPTIGDQVGSDSVALTPPESDRAVSAMSVTSDGIKEVGDPEAALMDTKIAANNTITLEIAGEVAKKTVESIVEKCDDNVISKLTGDNSQIIDDQSISTCDQEMVELPTPETLSVENIVESKPPESTGEVSQLFESISDDSSLKKKLSQPIEVSEIKKIDSNTIEVEKSESVDAPVEAPIESLDLLMETNDVCEPVVSKETDENKLEIVQINNESVDDVEMVQSENVGVTEIGEVPVIEADGTIPRISPNLELVSILSDCVTEEKEIATTSEFPSEILEGVGTESSEILLSSAIIEQPISDVVSCIDKIIPQSEELQDNALETLLAVANLQNDPESSYNIPPLDDIPSIIPEKTTADLLGFQEIQPECVTVPDIPELQPETFEAEILSTLPTVSLTLSPELESLPLEASPVLPEDLILQSQTGEILPENLAVPSEDLTLLPEAVILQPDTLQSENLVLQPDSVTFQPETPESGAISSESFTLQPESATPESVAVFSESLALQPESVTIQPETATPESVPVSSESVPVSSESLALQPESVTLQSEAVTPESVAVSSESLALQPELVTLQAEFVVPESVAVSTESLALQPESVTPKSVAASSESLALQLESATPESVAVSSKSLELQPESVTIQPGFATSKNVANSSESLALQPESVTIQPESATSESVVVSSESLVPQPEPVTPECVAVSSESLALQSQPVTFQPETVQVLSEKLEVPSKISKLQPEPIKPKSVAASSESLALQPQPETIKILSERLGASSKASSLQPETVKPESVAVSSENLALQPQPVTLQPETVKILSERLEASSKILTLQPETVKPENEAVFSENLALQRQPKASERLGTSSKASALQPETVKSESVAVSSESLALQLQPKAFETSGISSNVSTVQPEIVKVLPKKFAVSEALTLQAERAISQPETVKSASIAVSSESSALQPELETVKILPESLVISEALEIQPEIVKVLPKSLSVSSKNLTLQLEPKTIKLESLQRKLDRKIQPEREKFVTESFAVSSELQPEPVTHLPRTLFSERLALKPELVTHQQGSGKVLPRSVAFSAASSTLQGEAVTIQPVPTKRPLETVALPSEGLSEAVKLLPESLVSSTRQAELVKLSPKKLSLQSKSVGQQAKIHSLPLQSSTIQPKISVIEKLNFPSESPMESKHLVQKIPSLLEGASKSVRSAPELVSATLDVTVTKKDVTGKKSKQSQEEETKLKEPLVINVEVTDKERHYSPKITIKPIKPDDDHNIEPESKGSLKMTITKQSDTMHSILKIYDPENDHHEHQEEGRHKSKCHDSQESYCNEPTVPKLIIKPIAPPVDQHSPKMSTRSCKQVFSPSSSGNQRSSSPRITIKPIIKPESVVESISPLKITIKPVMKAEESHRQKHSPKLTIKPVVKPDDDVIETKVHSPRVTIKPIVKPPEELEQVHSPRITIKPIVKPTEVEAIVPRVTIKPVLKPQEDTFDQPIEKSPKITIKPIVKPLELESQIEEDPKERIVLKINKGAVRESRKREFPDEEKSEKLGKIKLKFSKEGGHPHIVQETSHKRSSEQSHDHERSKRLRVDETSLSGVTITPINPSHSKLKEMLSIQKGFSSSDHTITIDDDDDVTIVENITKKSSSPIVISEESNQDSSDTKNPSSTIIFEVNPEMPKEVLPVAEVPPLPTPRKRGRPRKVPLEVREDFKDPKEEEPKPIVVESTRPKRSCRGQSVRTTLGIKPRKTRGTGRGRGGKRGVGTRGEVTKPAKEPKLSAAKLKLLKEDLIALTAKPTLEPDDAIVKSPPALAPPSETSNTSTGSPTDRVPDIVMYEEETRMSAETNSRAQTPAKQVVTSAPVIDVEESQSSVQSTATTESAKARRGPRLEVHQEPEGAVISADQLAEYYWSGGGPYMLQEQVAQFLGIKSFKRKYPNIQRRFVDMQERDFIRESGLAGEAMCDLGLTAVSSTDILDIMYSDFQDKYEEYCKHQRERQAKDLTNKQKALSLAASQEKTKMDIMQQAVQSAASWNFNFNKERKEQRKACMDLQTLTVHFPKGKMKEGDKTKVGHYPVALVPGQFTDHYGEFTPTEINNLPLNTMCYETINKVPEMECDSQTDGSGSESDSSSSDSDSSFSGSSDGEDCTLCNKHQGKRIVAAI